MKNGRPCICLCLILQCPGKARCVCAGPPVQGLPLHPEYICLFAPMPGISPGYHQPYLNPHRRCPQRRDTALRKCHQPYLNPHRRCPQRRDTALRKCHQPYLNLYPCTLLYVLLTISSGHLPIHFHQSHHTA